MIEFRQPLRVVQIAEDNIGQFVDVLFDWYRDEPNFVPPVRVERLDYFRRGHNPLFQHVEVAFYLAFRGSDVVGRIAAAHDVRYNAYHGTSDAFFGCFECEDNQETADALLGEAMKFAQRFNKKRLVGPVSLSFADEVGLLVDGFERPPTMLTPYNRANYGRLVEGAGLKQLKDLWVFERPLNESLPPALLTLAQRAEKAGIRTRHMHLWTDDDDIRSAKNIFDAMQKPGFGLMPVTDDEFRRIVSRIRPLVIARPELALLAEDDSGPLGFLVAVPEFSIAQKASGGRFFQYGLPVGLLKMALATRRIERVRALFYAVNPEMRRRGIEALLARDVFRGARAYGYKSAEIGWIAEDDAHAMRAVEVLGATPVKRFRVYAKSLRRQSH